MWQEQARNYLNVTIFLGLKLPLPGALVRRLGSRRRFFRCDGSSADDIDLSPQNINDSQLQMMFVICHPALSPEAQIGLSLRILCGMGIEEIADAF